MEIKDKNILIQRDKLEKESKEKEEKFIKDNG